MSYETRYAAAMRARADRARSTPEAAAERLRLRDAQQRAYNDTDRRFGPLRDVPREQLDDALQYQYERIEYWRKELNA